MANKFIKNAPSWIKDALPAELITVLNGNIVKATAGSINESIDSDNVNDLAYNAMNPKKKTHTNVLKLLIKSINKYPIQYAQEKRKFKCLSYLAILLPENVGDLSSPLKKTDPNEEPAPKWYINLYLYIKTAEKMNPNDLYRIIFHSDQPINAINLIFSQIEKKCPDKLKNRKIENIKIEKQKDLKFYKSLSEEDKSSIVTLVANKKLILNIQKYLFEEGNLERIFICNGSYKLAEYCVKMNKISEFKNFVDTHRKYFTNLRGCHLIMPQFKELYEYAYSRTKYDDHSSFSLYDEINKHFIELTKHNFYREVKFMASKGINFDTENVSNAMATLDDNMINILSKECQKIVEESKNDPNKQFYVGQSLIEGKNDFPQNIQLGFQYIFKLNKEKNIDSIIYYVKILLKDKNKY